MKIGDIVAVDYNKDFEPELNQLGEELKQVIDDVTRLDEAYPQLAGDVVDDQLMALLDQATNQFAAARAAMKAMNKLPAGGSAGGMTKKQHASKIMSFMNKIRGTIKRLQKQLK